MPWTYRKSIKAGPLRVTASKRGVGVSVGRKGVRVGKRTGGRGYANAGKRGVRYTRSGFCCLMLVLPVALAILLGWFADRVGKGMRSEEGEPHMLVMGQQSNEWRSLFTAWLKDRNGQHATAVLDLNKEMILRNALPIAALTSEQWWGNESAQAELWRAQAWQVASAADLRAGKITFHRIDEEQTTSTG